MVLVEPNVLIVWILSLFNKVLDNQFLSLPEPDATLPQKLLGRRGSISLDKVLVYFMNQAILVI
jgi:hypothetical protein